MLAQFRSGESSRGTSRKPSPYPAVFHALRLGQLFSSLIVAAVLIFFIDHLRDEGYSVPWTFSLLLTTSLLTLIHLAVATYIELTRTIDPASHLISNAVLTIAWLVSLALLTWNLSWTLGHRCVITRWHNQAGVMICRMYKALAAFAVCGAFTTILALGLDLVVTKKSKERGAYNPMGAMGFGSMKTPGMKVSELDDHGESKEDPSYEGKEAYMVQKPIEAKHFGYEVPVEQTRYGG